MSENSNRERRGFSKLAAMIGGVMILAGIIFLGIAILASLGYLNVGVLLENRYLLLFAIAMVVIGLLNVFAAAIIARW